MTASAEGGEVTQRRRSPKEETVMISLEVSYLSRLAMNLTSNL